MSFRRLPPFRVLPPVEQTVLRCFGGVGIHDSRRVNQCGAGIDADGNAQSFHDFFPGCPVFHRRSRMHSNTAVALSGDRHRKHDQFARLGIQSRGLRASATQFTLTTHRVGADLSDFADRGEQLPLIVIPVEHHFESSFLRSCGPFRPMVGISGARSASAACRCSAALPPFFLCLANPLPCDNSNRVSVPTGMSAFLLDIASQFLK